MGRPPAHSVDDFLDAAVRLFAAGGARAVTMASVAREVGAPSGSIYHRFADRSALLAAVWLRTVREFQHGVQQALGSHDGVDAAVVAAAWTVDWCRENLEQAVVLHAGARALSPETWPSDARSELAGVEADRDRFIGKLVQRLVEQTGRRRDEVTLAVFDLPLAVVGKYLARGEPPPEDSTDLVVRIVRMILAA